MKKLEFYVLLIALLLSQLTPPAAVFGANSADFLTAAAPSRYFKELRSAFSGSTGSADAVDDALEQGGARYGTYGETAEDTALRNLEAPQPDGDEHTAPDDGRDVSASAGAPDSSEQPDPAETPVLPEQTDPSEPPVLPGQPDPSETTSEAPEINAAASPAAVLAPVSTASGISTGSGISTAEELYDRLKNYDPAEGPLELCSDLYWTPELPSALRLEDEVEVNTHGYTIHIIKNSSLDIQAPVTFRGTSTVFRVERGSSLSFDSDVRVCAIGSGISAVLAEAPDSLSGAGGEISVEGDRSAAVLAPNGIVLSNMKLTASGESAFAVKGAAPLDLTYCDIRAKGHLAAAVGGSAADTEGGIILDACYVSPNAENAVIIKRSARSSLTTSAYCISMGGNGTPELANFTWYTLLPADSRPAFKIMVPLEWSVPEDFNTSREATYTLTARLNPSFPDIDIPLPQTAEVPIYVFDPEQPRLFNAMQMKNRVTIYPFQKVRVGKNDILWCSSDQGESFYEVEPINRMDAFPIVSTISLEDVYERDVPYYFKLEYRDDNGTVTAVSNVLKIVIRSDEMIESAADGDRDFGDRGEQDPPDDDSDKDPDKDDPDHGSGGSGGNSGGHGGSSGGRNDAAGGKPDSAGNQIIGPDTSVWKPFDIIGGSGGAAGSTHTNDSNRNTNSTDKDVLSGKGSSLDPGSDSATLPALKSCPTNVPRDYAEAAGDRGSGEGRTDFTFTGKQLAYDLEAHPFGVTVVGSGARLILTPDAVSSLCMSDQAKLTVRFEQTEKQTWNVSFSLDGTEISVPFLLLIPGGPGNAEAYICEDAAGELYSAEPSEPDSLSFQLPGPGTYRVSSADDTSAPGGPPDVHAEAGDAGDLILKLLLLAAGAASIVFYILSSRRAKGKK